MVQVGHTGEIMTDRRGFTPLDVLRRYDDEISAHDIGDDSLSQSVSRSKHLTGFTLLELMMVVVIIGILATIALPQYFRSAERARTGEALQILSTIRGSEMRFRAQDPSNLYTTTIASLDTTIPIMGSWSAPTVSGTASGADVCAARNGGVNSSAVLSMDIETGKACASTAAAGADWGISGGALACGSCV